MEFRVVVFGGNQFFQYDLKEILANSFNGTVNEEMAFLGKRYYMPIVSDGKQYFIENRSSNWTFYVNGEALEHKRALNHGDYISASSDELSLAFLIISVEKCSLFSSMYSIKTESVYFIGRDPEMNIVIDTSAGISRKHASIRTDKDGRAFVDDISGKTGVYVNGEKISSQELKIGDRIFIMGTTIAFFGEFIVIPSNIQTNAIDFCQEVSTLTPIEKSVGSLYVRTPRIRKTLSHDPIEVECPPSPQKQKDMPFILTAGPSITMTFAMLASLGTTISRAMSSETKDIASIIPSAIMAVSMLLGALLWPSLSRKYNKRLSDANEKHRQKKYREYLDEKEKDIARSYERNLRIWNDALYPESKKLIDTITEQNRHLWERTYKDEDFLGIRLGLGQRPFEVDIAIKKKSFELEEDSLKNEAYEMADKYHEIKNVPITLSLMKHKVVGVVGDFELIAKNIITNLVALYSPDELKIVMVYNRYQEKRFNRFNDLYHMWSSDKTSRYVATSDSEAYSLFNELDEKIQAREETLEKNDIRTPHYVVLVFDQSMTDAVPFKKVLTNPDNNLGVSAIFFGERFNQIPKECEAIIQRNDETCGLYVKNENDNKFVLFTPDNLDDEDISSLVHGMSNVEVKQEKAVANVPDRVSFLDVYQVGNVDALNIPSHWSANNSNKSLAAPIGVMAGGERFYLDIHEKYHGCHGLVAGTTGSGKSEFLQAYILSMMINYSPNEVAFVLVDFKGGDMARPFLNSPHLAATISNLSGNTLYRALVSLEAEVKNRQRIFNESASLLGIDKIDINSYHKYFKEQRLEKPLPHLIIVIDEFAQLKTQHPEFMAKLIDIAQVGRSLGIHLILATQKPSGVVDPQIWSNSRFKVCLKVMDKQDSSDMINRPVAALIKNPGRAYVQVGYDEVFELIQSGYSGAEYVPQDSYINEDSVTVSMVNWPGEKIREAKDIIKGDKTDLTQLEAIMKCMSGLGKKLNLITRKLWLDPLPERLLFEELATGEEVPYGTVACGRIDLPHIQVQEDYTVNFVKNGHMAIYGASGTGKSTLIQTIFYAMALHNSPKMFNSFIMDFNGGSLIGLSRMPHCAAYVTDESESKVSQILNTIAQIITERRAKFVEAGCANYESYLETGKNDIPIILAVIDNYASFREKMFKCEDMLVQSIAAARACGIYFILTGNSKADIYYKVTDHINNKIVFNMNDTGSYRDILNAQVPVFPENIKGRTLVVRDKIVAEMQVAVPFDAESETNRTQQLNAFYASLKEKYGSVELYKLAEEDAFEIEREEYEPVYQKKEMKKLKSSGASDAISIGKDLKTGEIIDYSPSECKKFFIANRFGTDRLISTIYDQVVEKNRAVRIYSRTELGFDVPDGTMIEALDDYMTHVAECDDIIIINGFSDLFDEISDETLGKLENDLKSDVRSSFIVVDDMSRIADYSSTELYLHLVRCNMGMVIGGEVDDNLAYLLSDELYAIPLEYRDVKLTEKQALVYYGDACGYVVLGGSYE